MPTTDSDDPPREPGIVRRDEVAQLFDGVRTEKELEVLGRSLVQLLVRKTVISAEELASKINDTSDDAQKEQKKQKEQ